MRKWLTRCGLCGLVLAFLVGFTPAGVQAQQTVLNYYDPAVGQDNWLHVTGSVSIGTQIALTNAQVLALHTTPITIVAAPQAGYYIDVISVSIAFHYVGAYTVNSADDLALYWGNRYSGNRASSTIETTGLLTATADKVTRVQGTPDPTEPQRATALVIQNTSGIAFGGGNALDVVYVNVEYRIVKSGL